MVGSLVLHAALLGVAQHRPQPVHHLAHRSATESQPELDVEFELPPEPEPRSEPASAIGARTGASRTRATPRPAATGVSESLTADSGDLTAPPTETETTAPADAASATGPVGPRLSLTDLGVGSDNPFVERPTEQQKKAARTRAVKRRLDRALAQGLLDHDSAKGRGAGSPVMRILEAATYASAAPTNGNASFTFIIDSEGKLVSGSLGAVSSDREAWERVARQAIRDLASHKLRVPKGKGVKLTVQVISRLELPSGADPGVEVRAFGLPLKRGEGDRSTRVDVLNPRNPLAPLSMLGDPADIGATARRMVRAHVTSEELL